MTDQYEYFVLVWEGRTEELWRRAAGEWQYLSLIDWSWHPVVADGAPGEPRPDLLVPVEPLEAERLAADRQRWVRYWVEYHISADGSRKPVTVVRRRNSPEDQCDEAFGRDNRWIRTDVLVRSEYGSVPPLQAVNAVEADSLLERIRGVCGATAL